MTKVIKKQPLDKVLTMTNTAGSNLITERNGRIYRTPFKEEYIVSDIEKNDVLLFHDIISEDQGTDKILGIEYGELLSPIIDPDNNPIYTERLDTSLGYSIIPLEKGCIDPSDGEPLDWDENDPYIRSSIFIPIIANEEYNFSCPSGTVTRLRITLYDGNKRIITDEWNNGLSNYNEINLLNPFSTTLTEAKFLRFDIKGNGDPSVEIRIDASIEPQKEYLTVNKIRMIDDYQFNINDTLEGISKQFEISHDKPSAKINTVAFRAPVNNPLDVKMRLLNAGVNTSQFVDIRSVRDDEKVTTRGRCEIGIRAFGSTTPIPEFVLGFADSINGELIRKFVVMPDAIPMTLTNKGIVFRSTNIDNNNPDKSETTTINFFTLNNKIDKMYDSLVSSGLIDEGGGGSGGSGGGSYALNASRIGYDSEDYPSVAEALDYLIANVGTVDQDDMVATNITYNSTEYPTVSEALDYLFAKVNDPSDVVAAGLPMDVDDSNIPKEDRSSAVVTSMALLSDEEEGTDLVIGTDDTTISTIQYTITTQTSGFVSITLSAYANSNDTMTISYKMDDALQTIKFKQTLISGYNTISINLPISVETGDHTIEIVAVCENNSATITADSCCTMISLF